MLEFSEKYKAYAEEFPDAIVCWKHPGECHTEEGQKVIETYNQHYGAVAFEILYEVRAMLSDSTLGKIYSLVDEDEDMAFNKLRELLGKPIIYPEDELFYYYEPPYRNIKYIEMGYEDNFTKITALSACNSNNFGITRW